MTLITSIIFVTMSPRRMLLMRVVVFFVTSDYLSWAKTAGDEVVMLHVLFRHGDRSPSGTFPKNTIPESAWPGGLGQLTQRGMEQHYGLGQFLRNRYIEGNPHRLLSPYYSRHEITVRSTDIDRTMMSAYSNLAGLFPPNGTQECNRRIDWQLQPVPVHTVPTRLDTLLLLNYCPKFEEQLKKVLAKERTANKDFYSFVANVTGLPDNEKLNVVAVFDTLFCEKSHGYPLPEWINTSFNGSTAYDKLEILMDRSFVLRSCEPILRRLRGGSLVGAVVDNMLGVTETSTKCFMYSGHDITVASFLSAMNVFNGIAPPYATAVLVELIKSVDKEYFVKLLYRNDSTQEPYVLTVPGCMDRCPLTEFISLVRDTIPVDNQAECKTSDLKTGMSSKDTKDGRVRGTKAEFRGRKDTSTPPHSNAASGTTIDC